MKKSQRPNDIRRTSPQSSDISPRRIQYLKRQRKVFVVLGIVLLAVFFVLGHIGVYDFNTLVGEPVTFSDIVGVFILIVSLLSFSQIIFVSHFMKITDYEYEIWGADICGYLSPEEFEKRNPWVTHRTEGIEEE